MRPAAVHAPLLSWGITAEKENLWRPRTGICRDVLQKAFLLLPLLCVLLNPVRDPPAHEAAQKPTML